MNTVYDLVEMDFDNQIRKLHFEIEKIEAQIQIMEKQREQTLRVMRNRIGEGE